MWPWRASAIAAILPAGVVVPLVLCQGHDHTRPAMRLGALGSTLQRWLRSSRCLMLGFFPYRPSPTVYQVFAARAPRFALKVLWRVRSHSVESAFAGDGFRTQVWLIELVMLGRVPDGPVPGTGSGFPLRRCAVTGRVGCGS